MGLIADSTALTGTTLSSQPEQRPAKGRTYLVTVTLPTAAGFGSSGFYGQGFGYFSTGAEAGGPLAFIPSSFGSWTTNTP